MESRIAGYKLVPEMSGCIGCSFHGAESCPLDFSNNDCFSKHAIYVPADTAIEVLKTNHQEK